MTSRKWMGTLMGSLALAGVLGLLVAHGTLGVQAAQPASASSVGADLPRREVSGDEEAPAISPLDSPSPTCYRPATGTGACYIQWNYLYVIASSGTNVVSMTVTIDDRLRAYHSGFFQPSMYIPYGMTALGYRVTCGAPGSGGIAEMGQTYTYEIRARDTAGLSAASFGSVTCPADVVKVFLPLIQNASW